MSKIKNIHPKLMECVQLLLIDLEHKLPFYGEFNLMVNFHNGTESGVRTCGVNVGRTGMNFYYNDDFLEKLNQKMVNFIVLHENFHLLFNHPKRTVSGRFNPHLANIAQDMIINHILWKEINHGFIEIPKDEDGKNMGVFVPKEYEGELIFEILYNWLKEKKDEKDNTQKNEQQNKSTSDNDTGSGNKTDSDGNQLDSSGKPEYGNYGQGDIDTWSLDSILDNLDNTEGQYMDSHMVDEIPSQLRDAMISDSIERLRSRGFIGNKIDYILDKLRKKRKDYLKEIKRSLSNVIFGDTKHKTITKLNRRGIEGLKGNNKIKNTINVILDVSGSMNSLFEKVLSYVYRNDISINLIQCDTAVKSVEKIKNKKQLEIIQIKGLGGTIIQPAVDYVSDHFNQYNTVILTDGYVDKLDFSKIKGKTLIITTDVLCPVMGGTKKIKQIIADDSTY